MDKYKIIDKWESQFRLEQPHLENSYNKADILEWLADKVLNSVEEIDKKWFFPTDKIKDEASIVGAKWLRLRILGELDH